MGKIYNLLIAILITFTTQAQLPDWAWASAGIGSSDEESTRMCVDASGNVFITGMFTSSSATFASNVLINSGTSSTGDFFLAKYDGSGNLLWIRTASGTGYDKGLALATDPSGNCYVAGSFESSSITLGAVTLTNTSSVSDIFVVKYNSSGTLLWAKAYGGQLQDIANGITADASGNCYITGTFYSLSVLFDSYGVINSGSNDAFVTKLDANGLAQWTDQIGGSLADEGYDIKADASGVYVVGAFSSPTLAAYIPNMINAGGSDVFFAKYDSNNGNVLFAKQIGGTNDENINSLTLDASGNIYMTGYFESSSLNLGSITINNTTTRSMMVAKYNSGGTVQWANAYSGNHFSYPDGIVTDNSGNLYISGSFNLSSLSFGTSTVSNPSSSSNGFLVKLNSSTGGSAWALSLGSTANEEINAVATDQSGSIFLTGTFGPTLTLGNFPLNGLTAPDLFIGKMCMAPAVPGAVSNVTVCHKASAVLTATPPSGSVINWYNAASGGTLLLAGSNAYTASSTGTFYVEAKSAAGCISQSRAVITFSVLPGALVSVIGKTLTSSAGNFYTWIECFKDSVLTSQTSQTMVLPHTGHYAVIVNANGCTDTSACNFYSVDATTGTVIVTGTAEQEALVAVSVFPNPNNGSFTIYSTKSGAYLLMDELGQIIKRIEITSANNNKCLVEGLSQGFYFLTGENRTLSRKILVIR
jgi:hypothetical protein